MSARLHLADGPAHLGPREVAAIAVALADVDEEAGKPVDVAAERLLRDGDLLVVRDGGESRHVAGERGVVLTQAHKPGGLHEQAQRKVEEVVATGALDGPVLAQPLAGFEDLFSNDPCVRGAIAQALEVLLRIAQTIGMVDTHTVEHTLLEPLHDERMCLVEDELTLHAQADERVHIEEAAIARRRLCRSLRRRRSLRRTAA